MAGFKRLHKILFIYFKKQGLDIIASLIFYFCFILFKIMKGWSLSQLSSAWTGHHWTQFIPKLDFSLFILILLQYSQNVLYMMNEVDHQCYKQENSIYPHDTG